MSRHDQPPPDPFIEWSDPPDGFHVEWVEHPNRLVIAAGDRTKCRRPGCQRPAVWKLRRSNGWWSYCDWHTYGSRIEDGKVLSRRAVRDRDGGAA